MSITNGLHLAEIAKIWNNDENSESYNIFSQINCYDYSKFCTDKISVIDFPSFNFYKKGELVKSLKYLPSDEELVFILNK